VIKLLRRQALRQGDQLAYTFLVDGEAEKVELTYAELHRRCCAIGTSLQWAGASGEPVLLLCPPGLDFVTAFLGCLYAGAIAVPAYPPKLNRSQLRLQSIIEDSRAKLVLSTSAILAGVERVIGDAPYAKDLRWMATDDIAIEAGDKWREPAVNGETLAMLQYTSGSTAAPKGVMVSHRNLLSNEALIQRLVGHSPDWTFMGWLPLYHDMGLIGIMLGSLFAGGRCVLMSPAAFLQKPLRWLQAISKYQVALSGAPNFAYDLCSRKIGPEERSQLDLSSWKIAFNGSEPISHETLARFAATFAECGFRREAFYPCYGLAEGTLMVSGGQADAVPVVTRFQTAALECNRAVPVEVGEPGGRPLVGCGDNLTDPRIAIVHPQTLTECANGEIGEVWVAGSSVAQGYWRRAEETARTFRAYLARTGEGPFLRTGDLGFILKGELFITGRLKDLIIIDGQNHYPQDIELTVAKSHPAIRPGCCAAVSIDQGGREQLVVVAELDRQHRNADQDRIIRAVRQAVAEEHDLRVGDVWLVEPGGVPKTSSGKIQRHACRANYLSRSANQSREPQLVSR